MKITNKHNLPVEIAKALETQWYSGDPKKVSVTRLIDAPRQFFLMVRHWDEIEEDVSERVWTLFGSAIHAVLEKTQLDNHLREERLSFKMNGIEISGAFDVYGNNTISDYKVTSTWNIIYGSSNDKWEKQLNLYAYMLRQQGFNPKKAQIIAILRDHQTSKAKQDHSYPQSPIQIIPIQMWDMPRIEAYVAERTRLFADAMYLSDNELPPCSDDERWLNGDVWAVMKKGRKSAIKLFKDKGGADELVKAKGKGYYVEHRPGVARRCEEYCPVKEFCSQYKAYKEVKNGTK